MSLEHRSLEEPEVREVVRIRTEQEFGPTSAPTVEEPRRHTWLWAAATMVVAVGALALYKPALTSESLASSVSLAVGRTVPVGSVPYGPDIAPGFAVDPSFQPSGELPHGFSLSAMLGKTIYGCGDHHDGGTQPPDRAAAKLVEDRVVELLEYLRAQPNAFAPVAFPFGKDPALTTDLPSICMTLGLEWRNGQSGAMVTVPKGTGPKEEAELRRIAHNVAKRMTDSVGDGIEAMRKNDPGLP